MAQDLEPIFQELVALIQQTGVRKDNSWTRPDLILDNMIASPRGPYQVIYSAPGLSVNKPAMMVYFRPSKPEGQRIEFRIGDGDILKYWREKLDVDRNPVPKDAVKVEPVSPEKVVDELRDFIKARVALIRIATIDECIALVIDEAKNFPAVNMIQSPLVRLLERFRALK